MLKNKEILADDVTNHNSAIIGKFTGECADSNITNLNGLDITRPVVGYEGYYEVSRYGDVSSLDRVIIHSNGRKQFVKGHTLKPCDVNGYLVVGLCKDGYQKTVCVHRLVAEAFIPNPDHLPQVDHLDCNKKNNDVSNLEWVTAKENTDRAYKNNLNPIKRNPVVVHDVETNVNLYFDSAFEFGKWAHVGDANMYLKSGKLCKNRYRIKYIDPVLQANIDQAIESIQPIGSNKGIPVLCVETGQRFRSMWECYRKIGVDHELLRKAMRYSHGYVRKYNLHFIYDKED